MERRPVVIIGSGPAGTATALSLLGSDPALAADSVMLEKARHPRPKVCAGGLIPAGLRWMRDHDVSLDVPHVTVHGSLITTPSTTVQYDDRNLCYVIRRDEFDASLAAACRERGFAVRENEPVLDLRRDGDGVRVETTQQTYHAKLVIGADGSGSLARRRLVDAGKSRIARAVMCDIPVRDQNWMGFAAQRYEFDFRGVREGWRGYRWIFPCLIDGQPHANVGAYSLTAKGSALIGALRETAAGLTARPPRHYAFPIHWYCGRSTRVAAPHVLLAGDAAGADPLMGEGISLAMEYGSLAAAAAAAALRSGDFSGVEYQRAVEASWLGKKLRRLNLATRLFYGSTWRLWFAAAEHSHRLRTVGLRWYNGVDDWDRCSAWAILGALLRDPRPVPRNP